MRDKQITAAAAADMIQEGMTLMIGGFLTVGTPTALTEAIIEKGVRDLTIIANDGGWPGTGIANMIAAGLVRKLVTTHIGKNPQVGQLMQAGELIVELVPQGTLAEQIRAGGAGLGGILTPTGIGTEVADGKQIIEVDGQEYLLEKPLKADVALIRGSVTDKTGNVFYNGTTRNFNPLMAMAAELVIVETEKLVEAGRIQPECVMTSEIFTDYIVEGEARNA